MRRAPQQPAKEHVALPGDIRKFYEQAAEAEERYVGYVLDHKRPRYGPGPPYQEKQQQDCAETLWSMINNNVSNANNPAATGAAWL